jgi:hypothetical protein
MPEYVANLLMFSWLTNLLAVSMEEVCKILEEEEKEQTERLEQHFGVTPIEFLCLGFKLEQLQYVMHA